MEQIEHLEVLVHNMKNMAATDNEALHIASSILAKQQEISNYLDCMKDSAEKEGAAIWQQLVSLLKNEDNIPTETVWIKFHDTLKALEGTSMQLRKCIFFNYVNDERQKRTLLHEVCSKNPPANVVKVLLDLIPPSPLNNYNHLALDIDNKYPLHRIVENGGSIDVIKLLINADHKRTTLKMIEDKESVYHTLIAKKDVYEPDTFSEVLRYLSCMGVYNMRDSGLLNRAATHENKTPLLLLVQSLMNKDGMTGQEIWQNRDFTFLLKATCYHYKMSKTPRKGVVRDNDIDKVCQEIEDISLTEAFLVCAPDFSEKIISKMPLKQPATHFLLKKDSSGQYPIHQLILSMDYKNPSYFMDTLTTDWKRGAFHDVAMQLILKHVPQCAQQYNDEGLLPLHIAADPQRLVLDENKRLNLVSMIWKAYPDAADIVDKNTGLPPFALAARGKDEFGKVEANKKSKYNKEGDLIEHFDRFEAANDCSFFLLRQHPEILSGYIVDGVEQPCPSKDSIPLAKRPRKDTM